MKRKKIRIGSIVFEARFFDVDKDYDEYISFWIERKRVYPKRNQISSLGIKVMDGNKIAAACFVYGTNSPMAQLGFPAVSHKLKPKQRKVALAELFDFGEHVIKNMGFKYIVSFSDVSGLTKSFVSSGYNQINKHDFMIKTLGG